MGRVCSRETTFTGGQINLISQDDSCREPAEALFMLDPTRKDGIKYTVCMYGLNSGQKCILLSEPAPHTSS